MKKLLVLTVIAGFLLGSNGFAASQMTVKEEKTINAIQKAAMKDEWTPYTLSSNNGTKTLYFKKNIKKKDYYKYSYQNRKQHEKMTVHVKVDYSNDSVKVEFADKLRMNPGRLGVGNKVDNVLDELANAIEQELSANA